MSTFTIFLILIILVSFLLMLVIMVQNPKGGGLSSSFGGASTQVVGGVKKTGDFLDKSTWTLAIALAGLILLSNIALKGNYSAGDSKVLDSNTAPVQIRETLPENVPATQEAPVEQAPAAEEQPAQE
jgi:preprotein translocase subunit SecG